MKTIVIRRYKTSDRSALLNIIDLNIPKYFALDEKADFENYLENELELYYVISFENKIVGCGGINFDEEKTIGVISWDIIDPDYQGKSFGKQLLNYRLAELKSMESIQKIIVRTSQITYNFYQKQGFEVREIISNYWAEGFDLYYMEYYDLEV